MKIPLFESLGVSEIRKIYGKYFEFHNSRSSYVFRWVYHIDRKDELIKHSVKFLLERELIDVCIFWCIFDQCNEHNLNSFIGSLLISQKLWPEIVLKWKSVKFFFFFFFLYINRCLTIECLLTKCITEELLCSSFVLVLRQWADLYSFSRVF